MIEVRSILWFVFVQLPDSGSAILCSVLPLHGVQGVECSNHSVCQEIRHPVEPLKLLCGRGATYRIGRDPASAHRLRCQLSSYGLRQDPGNPGTAAGVRLDRQRERCTVVDGWGNSRPTGDALLARAQPLDCVWRRYSPHV